jgi:hypothetical protein
VRGSAGSGDETIKPLSFSPMNVSCATTSTRQMPSKGSTESGKGRCVIYTIPDGGNDRAGPQKIEQKGQERVSRLAGCNVALYGSDDTIVTKLTVGIVPAEDAEATDLRRWFSEPQTDIRDDIRVTEEVLAFIAEAEARSVVMTGRIIGCPNEEGIDYEGATCPACPFWAGRDRWTGKRLH